MQPVSTPFKFNPYAVEVQDDPYPYYKVLRDHHPLYWCEEAKCWALSRYDDVAAACNDASRFSSARGNVLDDDPARMGNTLGTSDPPKHDRLRALVNAAFMRGRVLDREPQVRALTSELVDEFIARGEGDVITELSARISASVICDILGFERGQYVQIKHWIDHIVYRDPVTKALSPEGLPSRKALIEFAAATIEARRVEPRDDLISALVAAEVEGNKLTPTDLLQTVSTLLAAGVESFASFTGNAMLALIEHPDQADWLSANLTLTPQAVEELLRYDTPTQRFHRAAAQDFEMHGQQVKQGQSILVMYGSANRDERKFPDPDRLDLSRAPQRHLAMGHGVHFCLGAQLAKAMSRIFLEEWFSRGRRMVLQREGVVRMHSPTFRGLRHMPVRLA
jgi:cytochrome P450